jgi:cyclopropane-fatty-acyl-phospholipid synthase
MALIDLFLSRAVTRGTLTLHRPDVATKTFGTSEAGFPDVVIRFTDKNVGRSIVSDPGLGAAEAFMDGRLVIEQGDIRALVELLTSNDPWEDGRSALAASPLRRAVAAAAHRFGRINMERASKRNVAHHYDLSDRLYDLFLDADRQYSCAYVTDPANSLERAQADKKAHIAAKLALKPGMRVLDIGCGWGGMALYLHQKTGAEVLGVTLSEEQLKVARRRAEEAGVADKVRFELIDYRHVTGQFDRIVSVGMFEHVGVKHYRAFFGKCRELLTEDGVMLMHTIGRLGGPGVTDQFTLKYIFPGGYNPALKIGRAHV